jgi:hypothetical protein
VLKVVGSVILPFWTQYSFVKSAHSSAVTLPRWRSYLLSGQSGALDSSRRRWQQPDGLITSPAREAGVRVVREVEGGVVRRVRVLDDSCAEVEPVVRFLSHLTDSGYSPNTVCAYAYDLRHLAEFLGEQSWVETRPTRSSPAKM